MAFVREDLVVNSIIGEGTKFRGDFELNGLLRIDGGFNGTIESEGKVLIGRHGAAVSPKIKAGIVIVGGNVDGNIFASEKVTILSTGVINGDIETPRLIAEEGVMLNGLVKIVEAPTAPGKSPRHVSEEEELAAARQELDKNFVSN